MESVLGQVARVIELSHSCYVPTTNGGKMESYENRKKFKLQHYKNWDGPDIRIQTNLEAVDFLCRVQCFDVTLGRPLLREFTQDRVIDSDLQCVYSETETIFVSTFTKSMIESGFIKQTYKGDSFGFVPVFYLLWRKFKASRTQLKGINYISNTSFHPLQRTSVKSS